MIDYYKATGSRGEASRGETSRGYAGLGQDRPPPPPEPLPPAFIPDPVPDLVQDNAALVQEIRALGTQLDILKLDIAELKERVGNPQDLSSELADLQMKVEALSLPYPHETNDGVCPRFWDIEVLTNTTFKIMSNGARDVGAWLVGPAKQVEIPTGGSLVWNAGLDAWTGGVSTNGTYYVHLRFERAELPGDGLPHVYINCLQTTDAAFGALPDDNTEYDLLWKITAATVDAATAITAVNDCRDSKRLPAMA